MFAYFAGQLFDQASAEDRTMLMRLSFLPSVSESHARELTGSEASARLLETLYRRHLFTDRRRGSQLVYAFHALFREVYGAVLAGRPPERPRYATFADGHEEMLIGDAIARSAREGRWVDVAAG